MTGQIKTGKNLSVVVQGPISRPETTECLKSIRKFLPEAEIILSTWQNSDVSGLEYDVLVLNEDPQAVVFDISDNKLNNLNRMIVSSKNGIEKASREYVLKIRNDVIFKNSNVLNFKNNYPNRNKDFSLFKEKIFVYDMFTIKYNIKKDIIQPIIFHVSDWAYLGLKEDISELFNLALVKEPDFSRYFEHREKKMPDIHKTRLWQMGSEQYITVENARKICPDIKFENYLDVNEENTKISEQFIINNFIVLSPEQWGKLPLKKLYMDSRMNGLNSSFYYSEKVMMEDYNKYCNGNLKVSKSYLLEEKLHKFKFFSRLKRHFYFSLLSKDPKEKFLEFLSTVYYLIRFSINAPFQALTKK